MEARRRKARNLTLLLASVMVPVGVTGLAPALASMAAAFPDDPNAKLLVQLAFTAPALVAALTAPLMGRLLDGWGRKPVLVAGLVLFGLSGSAGYVLHSLIAILLSRAVMGLSMAALASGCATLMADLFSGTELNQFLGAMGTFAGFSGLVFQALAGRLADAGWRFPFLLHLIALIVLLLVLVSIDEPVRPAQVERQVLGQGTATISPHTAILIYALALAGMVAFFTLLVNIPFYLTQAGANSTQVGLAVALQTFMSGLVPLTYHRLTSRLSFQAISALVMVAIGVNLIVAGLTSAYAVVAGSLLVGGLGTGLLPPNLTAWAAAVSPPAMRAQTISRMNGALFLGQFLTPIVIQPLVSQVGTARTFGIVGGLTLFLAAIVATTAWRQSVKPVADPGIVPDE